MIREHVFCMVLIYNIIIYLKTNSQQTNVYSLQINIEFHYRD